MESKTTSMNRVSAASASPAGSASPGWARAIALTLSRMGPPKEQERLQRLARREPEARHFLAVASADAPTAAEQRGALAGARRGQELGHLGRRRLAQGVHARARSPPAARVAGVAGDRLLHRRHRSWAARWASTAAGTSSTRSTPRVRERVPVVGLWHSGGARLAEGVERAGRASAQVFAAMVRASGRVPQISVVLGPAAGGAAYGPALTDLVIMGPAGRVFVTGPDVVRSVTGEDVDMERLGGPDAARPAVRRRARGRRRARPRRWRAARTLVDAARRPGPVRPRRRSSRPSTSARCCRSSRNRAYDVHPLVAAPARRARRRSELHAAVGAEHRHHASAGSPAAPSA